MRRHKRGESRNFISFHVRADKGAVPAGISKRVYLETLIRASQGTGDLPSDWDAQDVKGIWRNAPWQPERSLPFHQMIQESLRGGFQVIVEKHLRNKLAELSPEAEAKIPPIREATAKEITAIEEIETEAEERRAEAKKEERKQARKRKAAEKKAFFREAIEGKRSKAAKKGWITRRKKARKKARKAVATKAPKKARRKR